MKNSDAIEALREIVKMYQTDHGESEAELASWTLGLSKFDENKKLSKIANSLAQEPNLKGKVALKIMNHLSAKGFIEERLSRYYLTIDGYKVGTETILVRFLAKLNKNPGIQSLVAISISIGALIISYLSYTKT